MQQNEEEKDPAHYSPSNEAFRIEINHHPLARRVSKAKDQVSPIQP